MHGNNSTRDWNEIQVLYTNPKTIVFVQVQDSPDCFWHSDATNKHQSLFVRILLSLKFILSH